MNSSRIGNGAAAPDDDNEGARDPGGRAAVDVSILVKALNAEATIGRCVRSCLSALEGLSGEVLIVDSVSVDATVAIASRFPVRIVQLARAQDRGVGVAVQLGYQHARGRFLFVIDADQDLHPDFLRQAVARLERDPSIAGVGGELDEAQQDTDVTRSRGGRRRRARAGAAAVDALGRGVLFRRSAIERAGGYLAHPSLSAHHELELNLRLRALGTHVARLPTVVMRGRADANLAPTRRQSRRREALGSGELIRVSIGKPYFAEVLRHLRFQLVGWVWWGLIAAGLLLIPVSTWPVLAVAVASALAVIGVMSAKRSVSMGWRAVLGWHVSGAGAVVGMLRFRQGDPARPIDFVDLTPPLADAVGDSMVLPRPLRPGAADAETKEGQPPIPAATSASDSSIANPYGRKAVRRGLLHFMSGRLYTGFVQLLLVALYVRYMVVQEYAAYATLTAMCALAAGLTMFGLERAALRYYPEARLAGDITALRRVIRTLTLVRLSLVLFATAAIALLSGPLLRMLQLEAHQPALWVTLTYLLAMSTTRYQRLTMQALMLQRELTQGLVYPMTLRLIIVIVMIWHFGHFNAVWGIAAMALTEWIQAGMQLRAYTAHLRELEKSSSKDATWRPDYREIRRYALVNGYSSILSQVSSKNTLRLIGATYLSPSAIAAFSFFQALGERIRNYLPVFLVRSLIEPVAMAHYLSDRDFAKLNRVISVALKLDLLVIAPLATWLTLSGAPAMSVLTGAKFLEYMWISVAVLLTMISTSHWALLQLTANAVSQSMALAKGSTIAAAVTLLVLLTTQPQFGVLGLVLASLVTTMAGNIFVVMRLRAAGYRYRLDVLGSLRVFINALIAGGGAFALQWVTGTATTLIGSILAFLVTVLVFAGLSVINRPFSDAEWDVVQRLLPRRLARLASRRQAR